MKKDNRDRGSFVLGPFTVVYVPYQEVYTLYLVKWRDTILGSQISRPNFDQCWDHFTTAVAAKRITNEEASEVRSMLNTRSVPTAPTPPRPPRPHVAYPKAVAAK